MQFHVQQKCLLSCLRSNIGSWFRVEDKTNLLTKTIVLKPHTVIKSHLVLSFWALSLDAALGLRFILIGYVIELPVVCSSVLIETFYSLTVLIQHLSSIYISQSNCPVKLSANYFVMVTRLCDFNSNKAHWIHGNFKENDESASQVFHKF